MPKFNLENTSLTAYYESSSSHTLGQGIAIIMKNKWARHVEEINRIEGRLLHLILKFKGKKTLHLICCYSLASKQAHTKSIKQKLMNYIAKIITKNELIIIAGDFNEDYILLNNNTNKCPITTNIISHGLINTHDISLFPNAQTFTWHSNNISRTLDYIFIDSTLATQYIPLPISPIESNFSDHYPIGIEINTNQILANTHHHKRRYKKHFRKIINLKKIDETIWQKYKSKTHQNYIKNNTTNISDINSNWTFLKKIILESATSLPTKKLGATNIYTKKESNLFKAKKITRDILHLFKQNIQTDIKIQIQNLYNKWKILFPQDATSP